MIEEKTKKPDIPKRYVSIDLETTGLDPKYCQILEMAAVIDDGTPIQDCPKFWAIFDHGKKLRGEPYALQMHSELLRQIAKRHSIPPLMHNDCSVYCGITNPKDAMESFSRWLTAQRFATWDGSIVPAGKNFDSFDRVFLHKVLAKVYYGIRFHYRALDPGLLFWNPRIDGFRVPSTEVCMARAGLVATGAGLVATDAQSHRAMPDAIDVVRLIRVYLASIGMRHPNMPADAK